jgi:dTDP-4-dehydrorhamnose reductase
MTKILVLGGSGMLGHKMFQVLGGRFGNTMCSLSNSRIDPVLAETGLFPPDRVIFDLDVLDPAKLRDVLSVEKPDFVVNCVGVIKQRTGAHDPILSISINSLLPHQLAEICETWGGRVIHFSTDCVFSGRDGSYTEASPSDAEDLYGKTKFLGEVHRPNALTLRTSIIGHELKNFASLLDWFLAQQGRTITGYRKVMYAGVTTNYLARVVAEVIEHQAGLSGLYQVASQPITKYDLLCLVRDAYGLDVVIHPEDEPVSDRTMVGKSFEMATGAITPPWPALVAELAEEYPRYQAWRKG